MKKLILALTLFLTASNLAVGVAYAAVCQSSGGARSCGSTCSPNSDGSCTCSGACSADEMKWVAGSHAALAEVDEY
jgi:hypothetical protein